MTLYTDEELAQQATSNQVGTQPTFMSPEQAAVATPNLPPPGAAREETLARNADALAEAAETQTPDVGAIPERFLEPDREIQNDIARDYMDIGTDHPYLKTCWANYVNLNSQKVWEKKAQGWQIATAVEFPEAADLVKADNTIRIGDVLLMCIRIDRYEQIRQKEENARLAQQYGLEAGVYELADKHPNVFKTVSTDENPTLDPRTQALIERRRGAGKAAINTIGQQMKSPNGVPGIPLPGAARGKS